MHTHATSILKEPAASFFMGEVNQLGKLTAWGRVSHDYLITALLIKKFFEILWNQKVHYHVHKSALQTTILSLLNQPLPHR
jgi:hypothetical protein